MKDKQLLFLNYRFHKKTDILSETSKFSPKIKENWINMPIDNIIFPGILIQNAKY